jgi:hypothetical protein
LFVNRNRPNLRFRCDERTHTRASVIPAFLQTKTNHAHFAAAMLGEDDEQQLAPEEYEYVARKE